MFKRIWDSASANWKLTASFVAASIWAIIAAALLIAWWDGVSTLSALVGIAVGWSAGILLAPYDNEEKRFQKLSKSVAGFVSGYLVAKSDRVFDLVVEKSGSGPLILNPYFARAIWMGVGCMIIAGLIVFVGRTYSQSVD
jgi:hypothetical protein